MKINVAFDVPAAIADGLANGSLERVGGIVRFADNKQIVAWLQESGNMSSGATKGLTLFSTLLAAVGTNAGTIETLTSVARVGADVVDLAVTFYALEKVNRRIDALQDQIRAIYDRLEKEYAKKRSGSIKFALNQADSFLNSESVEMRRGKFPLVERDLGKAVTYLLEDIDHCLDENLLSEAGQFIDSAILLSWVAAYCMVDFGHDDDASYQLQKDTTGLEPHVRRLVRRLVGKKPALYFHESVSDDYLERYIQIRAWLDGEVKVWERVVKKARKGFWNKKVTKALFETKYKGLYQYKELRQNPFYKENIPRAELAIENFQRLQSYAHQIESLEKPYRDYRVISELAAARLADHDDFVLVIDEDTLARLERLSA
ncbi:MAG: hypothetical protein OXG23_06385 [Chloroflexi bacterium]|nr:hypothetical protein [Chloroflexota bacterium]